MPDAASSWSLRTRLAWITAGAISMALVVGGGAMYWAANIEDNQMLDARLEQLGATVLSFVEDGLTAQTEATASGLKQLKTRPTAALLYRFQVWSRDGVLVLRSYEAPNDQPLMALNQLGYATVHIKGEEYRSFSLPTRNGRFVIQVAECIDERTGQIGLITGYYVSFLLLPFGLVFVATWVLMMRSLHSIDTLADDLRHRNPLEISALKVDKPPREILPILTALESLFVRVGHAFSVERRFTSVAAHEMRTPLAGMRAQAQLACTARNQDESKEALRSLITGVDRASYMLDQLLDLARTETMSKEAERRIEQVELSAVYQSVMSDLGPKANRKNVAVSARFPIPSIDGMTFGIHLLLRNLLSNAIAYTPASGRIEVSSVRLGDEVALMVDDSGPGIPARDRERAFERFNRLGQNRVEGVGLGLSIVLSVVELHHAKIQLLDSPLGGVRAMVRFAQPEQDGVHATSLTAASA